MARARRGANPELGEVVSSARVKFARVSAQKARDLADLIRGLSVGEARAQLNAVHRPSAMPVVAGALHSVAANYEYLKKEDLVDDYGPADGLFVGEITIDGGPMFKRFQPRAMGRAGLIRKRTCHLTIKLCAPPVAAEGAK